MLKIPEKIKLSHTGNTPLPLGFKKIHLDKIPLFSFKRKLLVHNDKYQFDTMESWGPGKPISKIIP